MFLTLNCKNLDDGRVQATNPKSGKVWYFSADNSHKPTYRNKYAMVNCFRYAINWIN